MAAASKLLAIVWKSPASWVAACSRTIAVFRSVSSDLTTFVADRKLPIVIPVIAKAHTSDTIPIFAGSEILTFNLGTSLKLP